jgi:MYXO-CTERM domain-containing protein
MFKLLVLLTLAVPTLAVPTLAGADVRVPGQPYAGPARRRPPPELPAQPVEPEAKAAEKPKAEAGVVAAAPEVAPVAPPAAMTPAFTEDTRATAEKPQGFAYSILRDAYVDDVRETYLYIKSSPEAKSSVTVPIPKNRELLAQCIKGGSVEDLVHGAIATVRYDPTGVVRPDIEISQKVEVEVYDDARVLDRGGTRLYIRTKDGREKGFNLDGGAPAWDEVIEGAKFNDLVPGTLIRVEHDPGGRKAIRVVFKQKAIELDSSGNVKAAKSDKGCGCDTRAGELPWGAAGLGAVLLGLVVSRRQRIAVKARG